MKKRRTLALVITAAMLAVEIFAFPVQAGAAAPAQKGQTAGKTLNSMIAADASEEKDEAPDGVIVMFDGDGISTRKEAKRALAGGDEPVKDITVEQVWDFDTDQDGGTGADGTAAEQDTTAQDTDEDGEMSIALVKSDSLSTGKLISKLKQRDDVKYAEPNFRIHALAVSNDPYSDYQWSMQTTSEEEVDSAPNVAYEWTANHTEGSDERIVAVVDTGIDYTHPDIKDNMWVNDEDNWPKLKGRYGYDFIGGDDDPMDENGHGTHCAGIIGARGDNEEGISGVNKKIKLMALRILDAEGGAYLSHEIAAYHYINRAIDLGYKVTAINNSWGGGEQSDIFEDLINTVGAKGAVTVCAAGNDGLNNDQYPDYPSNIDSPYLITVAATKADGNLVSFSNYGQSVDIAAPGADILSAVPYNCYNPTLYEDRQADISEKFNDFDHSNDLNDGGTWGMPDDVYFNGKLYSDIPSGEKPELDMQLDDGGFISSGKSLHISLKGMPAEGLFCYTIPYDVPEDMKHKPVFSVMAQCKGPENANSFMSSPVFAAIDAEAGIDKDLDTIGNMTLSFGTYIESTGDYWSHLYSTEYEDELIERTPGSHRELILLVYANKKGDYDIKIDDIGLCRQDLDSDDAFGKYEFMSGTSMATPYISGSVALKAAEMDKDSAGAVDGAQLADTILSMTKDEPELPQISNGSFDFTKLKPAEKQSPGISNVTVDQKKKQVTIRGRGLNPEGGIQLEIGDIDSGQMTTVPESAVLDRDQKGTYIVLADQGWINNVNDVRITGYGGKTAEKKNIYFVKGKSEYKMVPDMAKAYTFVSVTTDGRYIYYQNEDCETIGKLDPKENMDTEVAMLDGAQLFKVTKDPKKDYAQKFRGGLVYMNGKLYSILEFGEADESETYSEDDEYVSDKSIYSGDFRLIEVTLEDEEMPDMDTLADMGEEPEEFDPIKVCAGLPAALKKTERYTMAAYNGRLYVMGGYSHVKDNTGLTDTVWIYDPKTNKWSAGPKMPQQRAGGKALQSGNSLIYTMGYEKPVQDSTADFPANLIFNGKSWKVSAAPKLSPVKTSVTGLGGDIYAAYQGDVSLVSGGLVYVGQPVKGMGDTFTYDLKSDSFKDTGYNFMFSMNDPVMYGGAAVGSKLYAFGGDEEQIYTIPVKSGLVTIATSKTGKGKVYGAGSYMPGETATVRAKASSHNHIKTLTVNGSKVTVKKNAASRTLTFKNITSNKTVKCAFAKDKQFKVTVKKKGKGKVKGAKKYYAGSKVKIVVKAAKKFYIKSLKIGGKKIKLKKNQAKKVYTIKKINKNIKVKVVFAKKIRK